MKLTHHDVFALAGYATTAMHKALHRNSDVIYAAHATIELGVKSEYAVRVRQGLRLSAYYQRSVSTMLREIGKEQGDSGGFIIDASHPLHRIGVMPLQRNVYSRTEIDDATEHLDKACRAVRDLVRAQANQTEAA